MVNRTFDFSLFNAAEIHSEITSKVKLDCNKYIYNPNGENMGTVKIAFQTDCDSKKQKRHYKICTINKNYFQPLHKEVKLNVSNSNKKRSN